MRFRKGRLNPLLGVQRAQDVGRREETLSVVMADNVERLKHIFHYPQNEGLHLREIAVAALQSVATVVFLDGAANTRTIESHIIEPLMATWKVLEERADPIPFLGKHVLSTSNVKVAESFRSITEDLLNGNVILLLEGNARGLSVETEAFQTRSISEPTTEKVLKGPKEAFVESLGLNLSLIRKALRDPNLYCERITVGERSMKNVAVVHLNGVASPEVVENVKAAIRKIERDTVQDLSILEQLIEERPYSLLPSTLMTERPDRTVSFLLEGHIAVLMDDSPYALIAPVTFWSFFHTPEDQYLRIHYGNFIRMLRIVAMFVALLTPSLYISVSTFHEEMLPTDLVLAIGATRERVPFPAFLEVLIMEIAFELVREAGIRIPAVMGPTIGIVGALLLGQAAVDANIISPILVIIVALTGLSSFAIPEINMNFAVRILRFPILLCATFMGFFGIAIFLTGLIAYMVSLTSFGVPFLSPLAPHLGSSKDLILRPPVWKQWLRPFYAAPVDKSRAEKPKGSNDL